MASRSHRPLQRGLRRGRDGVSNRGPGRSRAPGRRVSAGPRPAWAALGSADRHQGQYIHPGPGDHRRLGGLPARGPRARGAAGCHGGREVQGRGRHHRRARQHARPGQQRHEPQQLVRSHRQRLRRAVLPGRLLGRHRDRGGHEHGGAGQWHRHRQLDSHARRHQRPHRRLSHARPRQHRWHRTARLAARQYRPHRAHGHGRRDRARGDGRRGSPRSCHGGLAERGAAGVLRAVPPNGCPQGQTVRRAGVRSRRRWRSLPRHTGAGAGSVGREASRGREGAASPADACAVPGRGRGPAERRRRGALRRPDPVRELREDGQPRGHLRLHARRHESLPLGIRPQRVPLGG